MGAEREDRAAARPAHQDVPIVHTGEENENVHDQANHSATAAVASADARAPTILAVSAFPAPLRCGTREIDEDSSARDQQSEKKEASDHRGSTASSRLFDLSSSLPCRSSNRHKIL